MAKAYVPRSLAFAAAVGCTSRPGLSDSVGAKLKKFVVTMKCRSCSEEELREINITTDSVEPLAVQPYTCKSCVKPAAKPRKPRQKQDVRSLGMETYKPKPLPEWPGKPAESDIGHAPQPGITPIEEPKFGWEPYRKLLTRLIASLPGDATQTTEIRVLRLSLIDRKSYREIESETGASKSSVPKIIGRAPEFILKAFRESGDLSMLMDLRAEFEDMRRHFMRTCDDDLDRERDTYGPGVEFDELHGPAVHGKMPLHDNYD